MLLPCYIRQDRSKKSVQVYAENLYALANDAFAEVDKAVLEFLCMKVMGENPKTSQAAVQSALAKQNL